MVTNDDHRTVRFEPRRRDDLRPSAEALIGQVFEVTRGWLVTEEDGGDYVGQWVWLPMPGEGAGWLPDCATPGA